MAAELVPHSLYESADVIFGALASHALRSIFDGLAKAGVSLAATSATVALVEAWPAA